MGIGQAYVITLENKFMYTPYDEKMNHYLKYNIFRVEGFIRTLDANLFATITNNQSREGITGSLVEIGVHHGRSFFLLALSRKASEKSLAIDLFEDDQLYSDPKGLGRIGNFYKNRKKLNIDLSDEEIIKGSSLELSGSIISKLVGPVRFFSIDGGHMYENVENDLVIAEHAILDEGVIVVDDFTNNLWPEVCFATYDWLKKNSGEFAAFATTDGKLYICRKKYVSNYREVITSNTVIKSDIRREISILGNQVTALKQSIRGRAFDHILYKFFSLL